MGGPGYLPPPGSVDGPLPPMMPPTAPPGNLCIITHLYRFQVNGVLPTLLCPQSENWG